MSDYPPSNGRSYPYPNDQAYPPQAYPPQAYPLEGPAIYPHVPVVQGQSFAPQPYGTPFYPMPPGNMMIPGQAPTKPQLTHRLQMSFQKMYIVPCTNNFQQSYTIYESRIHELNEICQRYTHTIRSVLIVILLILFAIGTLLMNFRGCVIDPNGSETFCTTTDSYRRCNSYYKYNCTIPIYAPIILYAVAFILFVITYGHYIIFMTRLATELDTKLGEINQADSSYGVTWALKTKSETLLTSRSVGSPTRVRTTNLLPTTFHIEVYFKN